MNSNDIQMIKKLMQETVEKCNKKQKPKDCFKATEKILYSLDKLRIKVETDRQDIQDMIKEKESKSTSHAMRKPGGPDLDDDIRHKQKVRNRERAMLRTEKLICMIERGLDQIKHDDWYEVIEYTYLVRPRLNTLEVAEKVHCNERTVRRHKSRLINELSILFYGADALDI